MYSLCVSLSLPTDPSYASSLSIRIQEEEGHLNISSHKNPVLLHHKYFILTVLVCAYGGDVHTRVLKHAHGGEGKGQRTTSGSCSSPFTIQVLKTGLLPSGMAESAFNHKAIPLASCCHLDPASKNYEENISVI